MGVWFCVHIINIAILLFLLCLLVLYLTVETMGSYFCVYNINLNTPYETFIHCKNMV